MTEIITAAAGETGIGTVEQPLLELIAARVREGIPVERLAQVIGGATPGRICERDVETADFVVRTELSVSDFNTVTLAGNRIVARASGAAKRDEIGRVHAWFDPTQPVRVTFTHISGAATTATGMLPFQHALVADDLEYRFLLSAGNTSFVKVTAHQCLFP